MSLNCVYSVSSDLKESNENNLKYVPGKARSHHLEMMMSKEELEEEQRSVNTTYVLPLAVNSYSIHKNRGLLKRQAI